MSALSSLSKNRLANAVQELRTSVLARDAGLLSFAETIALQECKFAQRHAWNNRSRQMDTFNREWASVSKSAQLLSRAFSASGKLVAAQRIQAAIRAGTLPTPIRTSQFIQLLDAISNQTSAPNPAFNYGPIQIRTGSQKPPEPHTILTIYLAFIFSRLASLRRSQTLLKNIHKADHTSNVLIGSGPPRHIDQYLKSVKSALSEPARDHLIAVGDPIDGFSNWRAANAYANYAFNLDKLDSKRADSFRREHQGGLYYVGWK